MKKQATLFFLFSLVSLGLLAQNELKLWYEKPAKQWTEALPIGNGFIGGWSLEALKMKSFN